MLHLDSMPDINKRVTRSFTLLTALAVLGLFPVTTGAQPTGVER